MNYLEFKDKVGQAFSDVITYPQAVFLHFRGFPSLYLSTVFRARRRRKRRQTYSSELGRPKELSRSLSLSLSSSFDFVSRFEVGTPHSTRRRRRPRRGGGSAMAVPHPEPERQCSGRIALIRGNIDSTYLLSMNPLYHNINFLQM